jgi:hypothetical protein
MQMSLTRFAATHKAEKVFGFRQRHSGWIQIELKVASLRITVIDRRGERVQRVYEEGDYVDFR